LSAGYLLSALYEERDEPESAVIKVRVHLSRKQLNILGVTIESRWGTGYRLARGHHDARRPRFFTIEELNELLRLVRRGASDEEIRVSLSNRKINREPCV
jgi:hypothetical protein